MLTVKRALISVYDKTGIVTLAKRLRRQGVEIISTGGTLEVLRQNKIKVTSVSEVTDFPEILNGRVKTLHPLIHGGILFKRGNNDHLKQISRHEIKPIDMVVVNLYPFTEVIKDKRTTLSKALEMIDIGGPAMLRAAAKNYTSVAVVSDPQDYDVITASMKRHKGRIPRTLLRIFAQKVFSLTAYYDSVIAGYLSDTGSELPEEIHFSYEKILPLRYGENPHQRGALYKRRGTDVEIKHLHGKKLSYNNIMDINAATDIIREFRHPAVAVIKHTNPCGIAEHRVLTEALKGAIECDPLSAFGGIVVVNRTIDKDAAKLLFEKLAFFEVLIAPYFKPKAFNYLKERKNLRLIEQDISKGRLDPFAMRQCDGGMLVQDHDVTVNEYVKNFKQQIRIVSKRKPSPKDIRELLFAWQCTKVVKSNAIVMIRDKATVGIGAGQMSRVDAMMLAARKAGERSNGAYVASDGFFPKADNIEVASRAGVKAIIQPGGSIRDDEVIAAVNEFNLIMVCTGKRHFRH